MIIFDFDGTLIDVWKRYYEIFKQWWKLDIDMKTFKKLKWQNQNEPEILKSLEVKFEKEDFSRYKMFKTQKLEEREFLSFDELIIDPNYILKIKDDYMILTMRKNVENFFWQLERFGLKDLFKKKCFVLTPKGIDTKLEWLENAKDLDNNITVVGDSETDLKMAELSGQNTKVNVYLVKTGLRDPYKIIQTFGLKASVIENVNYFLQTKSL